VAFTPPGTDGLSAVGFGSPSGGGEEGDLASSDIAANARTSGAKASGENVNFYQLEDTLSTLCAEKYSPVACRNGQRQELSASLRLIGLDQISDALSIGLTMTVAGDGIGAASRLDANF